MAGLGPLRPVTDATWPERIVFVCKATQAAIVNRAPLHHAGLERIVGLVVLCGVKDRTVAGPTEQREAIEPARQLRQWARNTLRLADDVVVVHDGDPDSVMGWDGAMGRVAEMARRLDATVVFNLSGGRIAMTYGAENAWPADAPPPWVIHMAGAPLRSFLIDRVDGRPRQRALPVAERITLDDYLKFYGVLEYSLARREDAEGGFLRQAAAASVLYERSVTRWGRDAFRIWNAVFAGARAPYPCSLSLNGPDRALVGWLIDGAAIDGVSTAATTATVETPQSAKFLTGGWLEAHLYNLILHEFGNDEDVSIACNLSLCFAGSKREFTEFDIAFLRRGQLHVIEAKAVTATGASDGRFRDSLAKLAYLKGQMLGQQGQAWLVAPMLDDEDMKRGDFARAAAEAGIRLLYGPAAVDRLVVQLRALP